MFKNKYSNVLTVVLIATIIAILTISTILMVNVYKKYKNNKDAATAISDFDNSINNNIINLYENSVETQELIEQNIINNNNTNTTKNEGTRKVTYYKNFVMLGYIEIPKISIKYPILEEETVDSLEKSVAIRYPDHATLNAKGNVVIVGHNYRNGMFFSNLKKVSSGDIVKITDTEGKTLNYHVYEIYQTTPEDTAYITRDVGENTEITLVTCTDDSSARIIIKAKAKTK